MENHEEYEEILYNWDVHNGPAIYSQLLYSVVIQEWADDHALHVMASTMYNYRRGLPRVIEYFEGKSVQDVTAEMVVACREELKEELGVESSVRLYCKIMSLSLQFAQLKGYIYYNPVAKITLTKRTRARVKPFLEWEIPLLLSQECAQWVTDSIVIAFYSGMRQGEIFALKWADINLDAGYVMVQDAISKASSKTKVKCPKTPTGVRRVDTGIVLKEYLRSMERRERKAGSPYVFPASEKGKYPYRVPWNVAKTVKEMCVKAGIAPRDFRSLRHSHATVLLSHGVHPKVVQDRLGHSDFYITMDTYSFVTPTIQREATDVMDDLHVFPVAWVA